MNQNTIYTGIMMASILSSCCVYKTEVSKKKFITGEIIWKNKIKDYDTLSRPNNRYVVLVHADIGNKMAEFYKEDITLHQADKNSLVSILCREVYDCKYRKEKVISKSLSKLKVYHVCRNHCQKNDSTRIASRNSN